MTRKQKIVIGVIAPLVVYVLAAIIVMVLPRTGTDIEGQCTLTMVFLLPFLILLVAILNLWVLKIEWKNDFSCFMAGLCVPTAAIVLEVLYCQL
jgi:Zn-dependent protease with chaperone function